MGEACAAFLSMVRRVEAAAVAAQPAVLRSDGYESDAGGAAEVGLAHPIASAVRCNGACGVAHEESM